MTPTPEQIKRLRENHITWRDSINRCEEAAQIIEKQATEIAELKAKIEALEKDAKRYQWLRKTTKWVSSKDCERIDVRGCPEVWDNIIDAAIAGEAT